LSSACAGTDETMCAPSTVQDVSSAKVDIERMMKSLAVDAN
jgi:hypothetical protein